MTGMVAALGLLLLGAIVALLARRSGAVAGDAGAAASVGATVAAAIPALRTLAGAAPGTLAIEWRLPLGAVELGLDALSAFFLLPVLLLGALGAIYGRAYLGHGRAPGLGTGATWAAYNFFLLSLLLLLLARNVAVFLFAWEGMAVSAWLLISAEHHRPEARRAGFVFLAASHAGGALVAACLLLLGRGAPDLGFASLSMATRPTPGMALAVFVLALLGFGLKAGLAPLHFWLREAHAAAPAHVSALLSGAMINMGFYGLLRVSGLSTPPAAAGPLLLLCGLLTAFLGAALALGERDLKRALASSTVENAGLIAIGLGLGFWGVELHSERLAALGFAGALLHVWNHALLKGALFLAAGGMVHATGTRDLERMGGLLRLLPVTGAVFVLAAAALSALPPLNGFLSELLLYLGLLDAGLRLPGLAGLLVLVAGGVLALVGGLVLLSFTRLIGIALLGQPRHAAAAAAREPAAMTAAMAILLGLAIAVGLAPRFVLALAWPAIEQAIDDPLLTPLSWSEIAVLPWGALGTIAFGLWLCIALCAALAWALRRGRPTRAAATWNCGYLGGTARMQYTARSYAQLALERLLPGVLRPRVHQTPVVGVMPEAAELRTESTDPVLGIVLEPWIDRWGDRFSRLRMAQQGNVLLYLGYVFAALVVGLAWLSLRGARP